MTAAPVHCAVSGSEFSHNSAIGGSLANGNGANAGGGGLSNDRALAIVIDSIFSNNQATGGKGIVGRNGTGGGIYNSLGGLIFSGDDKSVVTRNHARRGSGTSVAGQGLGGGIFGDFVPATEPDVFGNHASDDGDDLFEPL